MFGVKYATGNVRSNGAWDVDDFIVRENRVYMVAVPKDYINIISKRSKTGTNN